MSYTWTAEERHVPTLGKNLKTGEEFEASDSLGANLVDQGVAKRTDAQKPSRRRAGSTSDPED